MTSNDNEQAVTYLAQVGWSGGLLTIRYVGIPKVTDEANKEIEAIMRRFSTDCQRMLIWFAGILQSRDVIKRYLNDLADKGEPLAINTYRPDGRIDSVLASLPVENIVKAVSDGGEFERLYAKAFVVFTYQIWNDLTRKQIAKALKLEDQTHVKCDLVGDLRLLRNWLIHPTKKAEQKFFGESKILSRSLGLRRNDPSLTAAMIAVLMRLLNNMKVDIDPKGLGFGMEVAPASLEMLAQVADAIEPGIRIAFPGALMLPPESRGAIVFDDGLLATVHAGDCDYANTQFQNLKNSRRMEVSSPALARRVILHMGKQVIRCEHCSS